MAFPDKLLNDGEEVIADLNPHWSTPAGPAAAVVVALALAIAATLVNQILALVMTAGFVGCVAWLGVRIARRNTTDFVITTDRLVYRVGVLARKGKEIPLDR